MDEEEELDLNLDETAELAKKSFCFSGIFSKQKNHRILFGLKIICIEITPVAFAFNSLLGGNPLCSKRFRSVLLYPSEIHQFMRSRRGKSPLSSISRFSFYSP